jgi:hydroxyacylglutathione hydrolase
MRAVGYFVLIACLSGSLIAFTNTVLPQAPQPDGAELKAGALPDRWTPAGPDCAKVTPFQLHEYNHDLFILRESGCTNYEKPFMFLLFGKDRVLLLDTGAGKAEVAKAVKDAIDRWLSHNKRESIDLVVAHTHAHGDHIAGDSQFKDAPKTTLVLPNLQAVQTFFGFKNWPEEMVTFDLGNRILDIIPIPGHEATSIAVYDRQTGILFTGDSLYPGRLYVRQPAEYIRSIQRLVDFTAGKPVAHIIGNHIENTRTPFLDYKVGTVYQPDEHVLELGRGQLLELNDALRQMNGSIIRRAFRDFTIWPNTR